MKKERIVRVSIDLGKLVKYHKVICNSDLKALQYVYSTYQKLNPNTLINVQIRSELKK